MGGGSTSDYIALATLASNAMSGGRQSANNMPLTPPGGTMASMGGGGGPLFNNSIKPSNSYALEKLIQELLLAKMGGNIGPGGTPPFSEQSRILAGLAGTGGSGNYGSISSLFG